FSGRDNTLSDGVLNGLGDAVLGRSEHLNGLTGVLDGDLVVKDRVRLAGEVRRDDREKRGEAVLVVRQSVAESRFGSRAARPDNKIDMSDLVAVADKRLADQDFVDFGHKGGSSHE